MTIDLEITKSAIVGACSAIVAVAGAYKIIKPALTKPFDDINKRLDKIVQRLDDNDDSTASVMLEKLMWSYRYYCTDRHPIPLDTRTALEVMYLQYTKSGRHNHVPKDFLDKLGTVPLA